MRYTWAWVAARQAVPVVNIEEECLSNVIDERRKARVEHQIAEGFLPIYNTMTGRAFRVCRSGRPPEPDIMCKDERTGEQIGIEVTIAYYDEDHATAEWETARGKEIAGYQLPRPDWQENVRVLDRVVANIRQKARKEYQLSGRLLLVVLTYSWRLYLREVEKQLTTLRIPLRSPFSEIHVLSQHGELYQLFPERRWILR